MNNKLIIQAKEIIYSRNILLKKYGLKSNNLTYGEYQKLTKKLEGIFSSILRESGNDGLKKFIDLIQ